MNSIEEIKESCKNNLNEKISSPFYGTFIVSWLLWNWKIWYVTFFIDSDLLVNDKHILKIDYIINIYNVDNFLNIFYSVGHILILPLLSSLLIVYLMPIITCRFYKKSLETDNANRLLKARNDEEFINAQGAKLEAQKGLIKKEQQIEVEKKKLEKSQEEVWSEEYKEFKSTKYQNDFSKIRECIYENGGYTSGLPSVLIAYFNVNDLVESIASNRIGITEKGKYFLKKYMEED